MSRNVSNNFIKTKLNRVVYRTTLVRALSQRVGKRRRVINQREYRLLEFLLQETEPTDPFAEEPSRKVGFSALIQAPYVTGVYRIVDQPVSEGRPRAARPGASPLLLGATRGSTTGCAAVRPCPQPTAARPPMPTRRTNGSSRVRHDRGARAADGNAPCCQRRAVRSFIPAAAAAAASVFPAILFSRKRRTCASVTNPSSRGKRAVSHVASASSTAPTALSTTG